MIETVILNHLMDELDMDDVYFEVPRDEIPARFVVIEKTGGRRSNHINQATFAVQSYGQSLADAADLNEDVITAMDSLVDEPGVSASVYQTDYNFTDTETKRYRYQCIYDITHYE